MFKFKLQLNIKKLLILMLGSFLTISLSGCYFLPKEEAEISPPLIKAPKVTFDTVDVKRGVIEKLLSVQGKFVSVSQQSLSFKYRSGNLKGFNVKIGDVVKKGDVLASLDTDSLESEIRDQLINVRKNEIWYSQEKKNINATEDSIEIKKLDLDASTNKLSDMQNEYKKSNITSPIAGSVVFVEKVNFGDYVAANKTLVVIADPTKLQVEYTGGDSSNFKLGDKVNIRYNNQDLKGKVVMTPATVPIDADKDLKVSIRVLVEKQPSNVSVGDKATVILAQARNDDTIIIPRGLVNNYNGRNYVLVLEKDLKIERDVEVGIQTATEVEILKGLNISDKIIVR